MNEDEKFEFTNEEPENLAEVGEVPAEVPEAGPRANRRLTHKQTAHVPGPRRKPKFVAQVVEVEDDEGAQSEPQASDSADSEAETDTQGFEKPATYGSFDS